MKRHTTLLTFVQKALARESKLESCLDNIYILVYDGVVIIAGFGQATLIKGTR